MDYDLGGQGSVVDGSTEFLSYGRDFTMHSLKIPVTRQRFKVVLCLWLHENGRRNAFTYFYCCNKTFNLNTTTLIVSWGVHKFIQSFTCIHFEHTI